VTNILTWDPRTATSGTTVQRDTSNAYGPIMDALVTNNASTPGGGSAFQYLDAARIGWSTGSGVRFTAQANTSYMRWTLASTSFDSTRSYLGIGFRTPADPSAIATVCTFYSDTDTLLGSLRIDSTGKLCAYNRTTTLISGSNSIDLEPNTDYFLQGYITPGTGTTDGRRAHRVLTTNGTVVGTWDSGATVDTGTLQARRFRVGGAVSSAVTTWDFGPLQFGSVDEGTWAPAYSFTDPVTPVISYTANGTTLKSSKLYYTPNGTTLVEVTLT